MITGCFDQFSICECQEEGRNNERIIFLIIKDSNEDKGEKRTGNRYLFYNIYIWPIAPKCLYILYERLFHIGEIISALWQSSKLNQMDYSGEVPDEKTWLENQKHYIHLKRVKMRALKTATQSHLWAWYDHGPTTTGRSFKILGRQRWLDSNHVLIKDKSSLTNLAMQWLCWWIIIFDFSKSFVVVPYNITC